MTLSSGEESTDLHQLIELYRDSVIRKLTDDGHHRQKEECLSVLSRFNQIWAEVKKLLFLLIFIPELYQRGQSLICFN